MIKANYGGDVCFELLKPRTEFRAVSLFSYSARLSAVPVLASGRIQVWASLSKGQLCGLQCFNTPAASGPPWRDLLFCQQLVFFFSRRPQSQLHAAQSMERKAGLFVQDLGNKTSGLVCLQEVTIGKWGLRLLNGWKVTGVQLGYYFLPACWSSVCLNNRRLKKFCLDHKHK